MKILFEGPMIQCLKREAKLRPHPGIGWNEFNGGQINIKASERLRRRLSQTQKGRKVTWGAKISKTLKGRKAGPFSDEHRENLRRANTNNPKVLKNLELARKFAYGPKAKANAKRKWTPERRKAQADRMRQVAINWNKLRETP